MVSKICSQWRGYSRSVAGVSLGFNSSRLNNLADKQGFRLAKCIYKPDEKYAIIDEFIDNYIKDRDKLNNVKYIPFNFAIRFSHIAPVLKHGSFLEEQEWRLISRQMDMRNNNIDFHPGSSILIPHYNFKLAIDNEQLEIDKLIIGPSPNKELASKAIGIAKIKL